MTDDALPGAADPADRTLLARHVAGDAEAFGELFRRHRDRLWAVALRTTGDAEDAADALQDAMVKAFRAAATFRGDSAVTTWLHRVVVNACLDLARRRAARPASPFPNDDRSARIGMSEPDPAPSHDLRLDISAALLRLPTEQRAALVLVDMQGFSVDEAAQILECPPGTVKSRCARGRARLLPLLTAHVTQPHPAPGNRDDSRSVPSTSGSIVAQPEGGQP